VSKDDLSRLGLGEAIVFYDGRLIFHIKSPLVESIQHQPFTINKPAITGNNQGLNLINHLSEFLQSNKDSDSASPKHSDIENWYTDTISLQPDF